MAQVRERVVRANLGYVQTSLHLRLERVKSCHAYRSAAFPAVRTVPFCNFHLLSSASYFNLPDVCDLFVQCLESMRCRFAMCVYGYVVMPDHVHLLLNEPKQGTLADAIHFLKLSFAKRVPWLGVRTAAYSGRSDTRSERQG